MLINKQDVKESVEYLFKQRNPHVKQFVEFLEMNKEQELKYLLSCPDEMSSNEKIRYVSGRASMLKEIIDLIT